MAALSGSPCYKPLVIMMLATPQNASIRNAKIWQGFFEDFALFSVDGSKWDTCSEWAHFFMRFNELRNIQKPPHRESIPLSDWEHFLVHFANVHSAYRQQGKAVDIWKLAKIGRDELRNCSILGWLLSCQGSHGQGTAFLRKLLLHMRFEQDNMESGLIHGYRVIVEESYDEYESGNGKQRSRVDIVLDGQAFLLLIEAKVQAGETDNQLERYLRIGQSLAGDRPWRLVYLTVDGCLPRDNNLKDNVVCVRWRDLGREFLRHADSMPTDSHGTVAIRQFCQHIINL